VVPGQPSCRCLKSAFLDANMPPQRAHETMRLLQEPAWALPPPAERLGPIGERHV
jgi:hypothetical protein